MSMKDLSSFCVQGFLSLSSDYDVYTFGTVFPEHEEAVQALWGSRPELNLDNVLLRNVSKLIKFIRHRKNLRRVILSDSYYEFFSSELPAAIADNCSMLEVLDIPGFWLSEKHVHLLSRCDTLKYLNIKYNNEATKFVHKIVAKNLQLAGISLNGPVTNELFEKLPATIQQINIINRNIHLEDINGFWNRVQTLRLEKLQLPVLLTEQHILMLSTQTTLKCLHINFINVGNSLEVLFRNNPGLEEVDLCSRSLTEGACLTFLPRRLKRLKLQDRWNLNTDAFVECITTLNLSILELFIDSNINFIMRILNAARSLSELKFNIQNMLPGIDLAIAEIRVPANLQYLNLDYNFAQLNNFLISLLQWSVNLKSLRINTTIFDPEIFIAIADHATLKGFFLSSNTFTAANYIKCMQILTKSTSLTTLEFQERSTNLTKTDICTFIQNCATFTVFALGLCQKMRITKTFLKNIVLEIKKQVNRREVLTVEIGCYLSGHKKIRTTNLHPMLNLKLYHC